MNNRLITKLNPIYIIKATVISAALLCCSFFPITAKAAEVTNIVTYPYQELLNETELSAYNQAYENSMAYNSDLFTLDMVITETGLENAMNALFNDHPELYWVNTSYKYAIDSKGNVKKLQLKFGFTPTEFATAQVNYNTVLNNIVNEANKFPSQLEKEKYIHDTICAMNTYNDCSSLNQSAYSAFTSGSSVCAGYARAFQIACQRVGIPCYYVTGTSMGETHAWNIVYIDGRFTNVDLTWDDCISEITGMNSYSYFNQNDLVFNKDHSRSILSSQLYQCN